MAGAGVIAVSLAGCAPSPPRLPDGISVDVKQYRDDYAPGRIELRLSALGSGITVRRVELTDASLVAPAVWKGAPTRIEPHQTIDFPADLPAPRCAARTAPRIRIDFALDGRSGSGMVRATQSLHDLDRLERLGCTGDRVTAIAPLTADRLRVEGSGRSAIAVIHVAARAGTGTGSYRIIGIQSTVLLAPAGSSATSWHEDVPVTSAGSPGFDLRVVPTRCDPHVVAEDKVGTILKTHVAIHDGRGTDPDGVFALPLAGGVKQRLLQYVARTCGFGS